MAKEKKLAICHNKGFHIRFENGWTISVQFGAGNYCDNYDLSDFSYKEPRQSDTAEVWCWSAGDKHYPSDPLERQTPEQILEIMNKVKGFAQEVVGE